MPIWLINFSIYQTITIGCRWTVRSLFNGVFPPLLRCILLTVCRTLWKYQKDLSKAWTHATVDASSWISLVPHYS
ncbi:hypothetical protein H5410_018787 [Solanum commersonii]|uniref:Uncharacterized protein n=1 Tax=Solanum commersonii TaxID=4109 RepID=A0A9J6A3T8_SOLCO|nr:hypothetical protein H5410_018787 [Solanum commersonii]